MSALDVSELLHLIKINKGALTSRRIRRKIRVGWECVTIDDGIDDCRIYNTHTPTDQSKRVIKHQHLNSNSDDVL